MAASSGDTAGAPYTLDWISDGVLESGDPETGVQLVSPTGTSAGGGAPAVSGGARPARGSAGGQLASSSPSAAPAPL
eukprot:scaffold15670_cov112-Isochrysis_galbana.AAC.6